MAPSFARVGQESTSKLSGDKYAPIPAPLRDDLRAAFSKACSQYTLAAVEAPAAPFGTQYELKRATAWLIPKRNREISTVETGFGFAATANLALIEHCLDSKAIDFSVLAASRCESDSADLSLANPDYLAQHAVEEGALSWGMDTFGCLTLCFLGGDGDEEIRQEAYFVQRVYGIGEEGPGSRLRAYGEEQHASPPRPGFRFSLRTTTSLATRVSLEGEDEDKDVDRIQRMAEPALEKERKRREAAAEVEKQYWAVDKQRREAGIPLSEEDLEERRKARGISPSRWRSRGNKPFPRGYHAGRYNEFGVLE